ncbi:hypothetical protein L3N51_00397 [Metallosphaera sp. J1]|uniref:YidH family protein n=1 Tax=Metallosphaera TaxID=41980 RepID=UPI001EDC95C4|nr:DUF202 domain-containing protein [Metallosphaera javensis (ex Hofmann et al. 2022)]MCG3108116.1 hypothetical protein [Metallosphaera javensis (ex Hofmann et al. 2022)]BCS94031.1 MAG: hypothetical protein MjAS7_2639 [Metallosphaera javensis (ex Sakai et al. 2022)]
MVSPSDHMANERTFLAWVRTGIALIGFGFVIAKFALFLQILKGVKGVGQSVIFGEVMIVLGAVVIVYGLLAYHLTERDLENNTYRSRHVLNSVFAAIVLIVAVSLALLVI